MALPGVLILEERVVGRPSEGGKRPTQDARGADPPEPQQKHACARVFTHPDIPLWQGRAAASRAARFARFATAEKRLCTLLTNSTRARNAVRKLRKPRLASLSLTAIAARAPRGLRSARVMAEAVAPRSRLAGPGARAGSAGWLQPAVRSMARARGMRAL